jgi:uncharacterized SAM-binding protein YcdF (DUF218 family)
MPDATSLDLTNDLVNETTAIVFDYPSQPLQPCDIIFVFGGSHPGLWRTAAEAFHKGLGKAIIATGGHKPGANPHPSWRDGSTPEAHVIRRELIKLLVPEERIFCEDRSTNSLENVLFAKQIYDFSRVQSILVVTKCFAIGRQCRTLAQQLNRGTLVIPCPFDTEIGKSRFLITRDNWMEHEESKALVLTQVSKIYRYVRAGHLQPIEHLSPKLEDLVKLYTPE